MTRVEQRLIIILLLIFFGCFVYSKSSRCYQVYVCCEKVESECIKYCEPFEECPDLTAEEGLLNNNTQTGDDFSILRPKLCRKGLRLVNGVCKRVL